MKTITIDWADPKSLRQAARELRKFAKNLNTKTQEFNRRLCEEAAEEAKLHYSQDVMVTATDNGVTATGSQVVFEEFGAGSRTADPYPGGADVSFEVRRGAYSDLHGGEYARSGYTMWHHNGEKYEYVIPNHGLFYGMEQARERAKDIAEEVFGSD